WATSLSAGESDSTYEFSFFRVVIDLTDAGHEHFEDIVALLFKYINLLQQSGTCKWIFDEVVELKRVSQRELIDFFNDYIKVGALQKKSLSVRVYGNTHSSEQQADNSQPAESNNVQIEDIFSFRRSRPLYGSFRGGFGHLKLKDIKSADQGQK
ncbi:UNVERIFIED_CONTAM: Insulin-degrading enzyme-like 1, peroxisomal, partial [Sesamum radiatum]